MPPSAIGETSRSDPLPANVSPTGMPSESARLWSSLHAFGVMHAAAGDQYRALCFFEESDSLANALGVGQPPLDAPASLAEKVFWIIIRMRLDILGQRDRDGTRLGRIREDAHRFRQRRQDLLRPGDAIEEAADRAEAIVDADIGGNRVLELLEHRPLMPGCIIIGGEQEHRQPVDGRGRRACDHVGRARPDRCGAGERGQAMVRLGEADRGMHHRLLVAGLVVRQARAALLECLAHAADVAVAEDAEHGRDQAADVAVALAVLHLQILHDRLRHRQADRLSAGRGVHERSVSFLCIRSVVASF